MPEIPIRSGTITLAQLLKKAQVADTGGAAKQLIQDGSVRVNGNVETRKGRQLGPGDRVHVAGHEDIVLTAEAAAE